MFFLRTELGEMLPTAFLGMLLALLAFALLFLVLRLCGFRLFWRKRRAPRREKLKTPIDTTESPEQTDLSEEELIVILTAAAMEALGEPNAKRFRVVAFRRV